MISFLIIFNLISSSYLLFHGTDFNRKYGATCQEFIERNNLTSCCPDRNDQCYIQYYDSTCYCDQFCGSNNSSDCCPDVKRIKGINYCTVQKTCQDGDTVHDNCNLIKCKNGVFTGHKRPCVINPNFFNYTSNFGWTASNYSQFWGQTIDFAYTNYLGVIPDRDKITVYEDCKNVKFYDFRNEGYFKNTIKNQGLCPSSWAFSIIDVITDRIAKSTKRQLDKTPSVEHLISCNENNITKNKCSPLQNDLAWSLAKNWDGIFEEDCYPSDTVRSGFVFKCKNKTCSNRFVISKVYRLVPKAKNIMKEIFNNGPVQMVFKVYDDFFMYKSGVYTPTPKARSQNHYHAVKVLGWGSEKGVDYWLAANSWGPNWGENGYFKIRRKSLLTEIGKHVYGVMVTKQ